MRPVTSQTRKNAPRRVSRSLLRDCELFSHMG
jgi:hypothetical protein